MHALGLAVSMYASACVAHRLDPAAAPWSPAVDAARPGVTAEHEAYVVRGQRPEAVRRALNHRSTWRDASGERFDGGTAWSLQWRHQFESTSSGCRIIGIQFHGAITVTTPSLRVWRVPDRKLSNRWHAYLDALWTHEQHHVARVYAAIDEAHHVVASLPEQPTCAAAGTAGNAAVQTVFAAMNIDQVAYDTETSHGQVEGAFWDVPER
ncbi:MAG: hypothetical protein RLZZ383_2367 [Pseudomonadota bacterium]|jgi:predicted secreted Zn-dependent protease